MIEPPETVLVVVEDAEEEEPEEELEEELEQLLFSRQENWVESTDVFRIRCVNHAHCFTDCFAFLTLEFSRAVNDDQNPVSSVGAGLARSQAARNFPVERLRGGGDACGDGIVGGNTVGAGSRAEDKADSDTVGGVVFWIPGNGELFALGNGLRVVSSRAGGIRRHMILRTFDKSGVSRGPQEFTPGLV